MKVQEIIERLIRGESIILSSNRLTKKTIENLFSSLVDVNIFCCNGKYIITTKNLTKEQVEELSLRGDCNILN